MRTPENPANPLGKLVSAKQTIGLDHFALAVDPLRLYGIQPRALLGQQAAYNPHSFSTLLDSAITFAQPASYLAAYVPASVVPDEEQNLPASRLEHFISQPHSRNRVVMGLTGLPSTNLSHVCSSSGT
jgi:hypothetical protein